VFKVVGSHGRWGKITLPIAGSRVTQTPRAKLRVVIIGPNSIVDQGMPVQEPAFRLISVSDVVFGEKKKNSNVISMIHELFFVTSLSDLSFQSRHRFQERLSFNFYFILLASKL